MKLSELQIFAMVAHQGSITRAAAQLSISQPAVSRVIANVEAYFGAVLLHRTGRGVILTQAGSDVLAAVESSLRCISDAREEARRTAGIVSGRIVLGITPMVGQTVVSHAIEKIRRDFPAVDMRVLEGNGPAIITWLGSGEIDLAVTYIPPSQITPDLGEVLYNERLCLIGAEPFAADEIEFAQALKHSLALPGSASGMRRHLDRLASAAGLRVDAAYQIDSHPTCMGLVLEGLAYTIAPELTVKSLKAAGAVHTARISNPPIFAQLSVHRSPRMPLSRASRGLLAALKNSLPE